ncbi:MAG: prepilin-type N-terminal cleavage/methylation domain-containing protein [Candidatus Sumerlaeota bacterium]|nr:prepilin-type N-terminal cleavage/methylation domain-containing protein [Candidatus Sumerlaeota bacterium]
MNAFFPNIKTGPRPRGMSLVEVLIALVIFIIGFYGLVDLAATSRRINGKYTKRFQAAVIAQNEMAILRTAGYKAITSDSLSQAPRLPLKSPAKVETPGMEGFQWQVKLSPYLAITSSTRVGVVVTWEGKDEDSQTTEARRLTQYGLTEVMIGPSDAAPGGGL